MKRPRPWEVIGSSPVADCHVFSVTAMRSRRDEGGPEHTFFRIDSGDWVNVVPITTEREVVMVRQYRHGLADVTLEIPGGMVDAGESPATAAARELLEETGYRPASLRQIGSVNPNPALFPNRLHTFLAEGCVKVAEIENDASEETLVELIPEADIPQHLAKGAIDHALVVAAFHWWHLHTVAQSR